jgi:hypothetical protein
MENGGANPGRSTKPRRPCLHSAGSSLRCLTKSSYAFWSWLCSSPSRYSACRISKTGCCEESSRSRLPPTLLFRVADTHPFEPSATIPPGRHLSRRHLAGVHGVQGVALGWAILGPFGAKALGQRAVACGFVPLQKRFRREKLIHGGLHDGRNRPGTLVREHPGVRRVDRPVKRLLPRLRADP